MWSLRHAGRVIRDLVRNGFITRILAGVGIASLPLGITQFFNPDAASVAPRLTWMWIAATVGLIILYSSARLSWPRSCIRRQLNVAGTWSITVRKGDLFESPSPIVITADRGASIEESVVGQESLVHQLVVRWLGGSEMALEALLAPRRTLGSLQPLGTVIDIATPRGSGWVLCLAEPSPNGSTTSWHELIVALDRLWDAGRNKNVPEISVPVIGSGYARAKLSLEGLLCVLILSFHSASLLHPVTGNLDIVIADSDYTPEAMDAADRLLRTLHYSPA